MRSCSEPRKLQESCSEPRILLRADAGSKIGFGHYVRTCALGGYLRGDYECLLVTRNPDLGHPSDYQRTLAAESGLRLIELPGKERAEFDARFLQLIREEDIVVLDNYFYETSFMQEVRRRCRALVCIDDMHDRHFPADIVMTFCPLTRDMFSLEPHTVFRGGMEWSFLREPFLSDRVSRQYDGELPQHIALAMGGADPLGLTDKMVRLIRDINGEVTIEVLAGQTVRIDFAEEERLRVHRQASAGEIAEMFDRCDLGIFPASTVCVEAFSRGLPVAAGYFVDNQEEIYAYGITHGWFRPLGDLRRDGAELRQDIEQALTTPLSPAPAFDFQARRQEIIDLFQTL